MKKLKHALITLFGWIKTEIQTSPLKIFLTIVSLMVSGGLTSYFRKPVLTFILVIILILILVILHIPDKEGIEGENPSHNAKKSEIILGFCLLGIFIIIFSVLFFPGPSNMIKSYYWPTKTPTITSTPIFSPTPSLTDRPTFTYTPSQTSTNTQTPTLTPTPTSYITPMTITPTFPPEEFSNSCIPSTWQIYPDYMMEYLQITPRPCPTYQTIGLSGLNPGLQIIARPTSQEQMTGGIYRKLPSGNFEIQVRFSDLTLNPPQNGRTSFYVMFFNSGDANGKKSITKIENSFYFSNDSPEHVPFLLFEKTPVAYSIESTNNILLTCEKESQLVTCSIIGTKTTPILQEITFDPRWDSVLVGYYADQNGYVKVNISHFQIIPK